MSLLKKTIGFVAVLGVLPAANALTARPSIIGGASSRMPTMTTTIYGATTSTTTTTSASLLANAECIESYTSCMKGADACGPEFEECTNKVLFHGKMAQCISTLAQCNSTGIENLFGVGNIGSLQTVATKNSYGEVTNYTYPTDGSLLGQMIISASISNKYDTSTCVKRYTSCLKKDSVCGDDFELCTTNTEFRKQRVYCDSTLARCQSDGVIELFGSNSLTAVPAATSRIGELIAEGAKLAATNSVSTCYKVIDQCILGACAANPYRCEEGVFKTIAKAADDINNGAETKEGDNTTSGDKTTKSEINGYIKAACLDTIGANKYCYATFLGNGKMPTASQLKDEDNQEEIFDQAYTSRMNESMKSKIADLRDKFDTKAKQKCTETIRACAMRTCGSGSGAACYYKVFSSADKSINTASTREEIKTGCEAIVNTDLYCKYAAANPNTTGPYSYSYINTSAFDTLFPEYDSATPDPIGVVASLNASLATNYSDAALAQMKKQCQSVATSCVKSLCGADYVNCYRNRTDVYSSLTKTGEAAFDNSMNKVGGVLDYTIVLGLCLDTVKNASVCEEHLAIEASKYDIDNSRTKSWGSNSVRNDWVDAGSATKLSIVDNDTIQEVDANGQSLCSSKTGEQGPCYTVDDAGNVYDQPVMVSITTYKQTQAASTLFKDLIYDIEKEAQAKYNAKLTKEQNACLAMNEGGLLGKSDTGSTYMWVKLRSNKTPKNYSINGLAANQFVASNDLYGSFCRARITIQSDDKNIQELIRKGPSWATAYFAVGDVYTCGSWIPNSVLEGIAKDLADEAAHKNDAQYKRVRDWMTALGAVGGTVGGGYLGAGIQNGSVFSGLTGLNNSKGKATVDNKNNCTRNIGWAIDAANRLKPNATKDTGSYAYVKDYTDKALKACENLEDVKGSLPYKDVKDAKNALGSVPFKVETSNAWVEGEQAKVQTLITALEKLKTVAEDSDGESASNGKNKQWIGSSIGSALGGVGGAFLLRQITTDIQDSNRDAAYNAAYEEFMNTIGNHIQCYIGGEEAGTYGQTYQIYME
ncbi:MAG: hypothetical protein K2M34_03385 [Alphaproteobacteria bacterium]|nr:hypothetical protein [Alphaproteobacteria bacterium]